MEESLERSATAEWRGGPRDGSGTMTSESGVLCGTQFSFRTCFANGIGTSPDELIAASLGGCFSLALSNELRLVGFLAEKIHTVATATLENLPLGWTMTRVQLDVHAKVPRATQKKIHCRCHRRKSELPDRPSSQHDYFYDRQS